MFKGNHSKEKKTRYARVFVFEGEEFLVFYLAE